MMKQSSRLVLVVLLLLAFAMPVLAWTLRIGTKAFTESVILGEIVRLLCLHHGQPAQHLKELGGSRILWNALRKGEVDIYPEYTGTLISELLAGEVADGDLQQALKKYKLGILARLGFSNTYALGIKEELAQKLGLRTISDLNRHPQLRLGFSNEFMERLDGWPNLRKHYELVHKEVRGLEHSLALRGLHAGDIHVTDLYSTDAEIAYYKLRVLKDDRKFFPVYDALLIYRLDLEERAPELVKALRRLEKSLTNEKMVALNSRVQIDGLSEEKAAAEFLRDAFQISIDPSRLESDSLWQRRLALFWKNTLEHLFLVAVSLTLAVVVAVPLGVAAYKYPALGQIIMGVVGVIQTLPSLALLVFMIPFLGLGAWPAIVALFLYSLLPIVRNTCNGLQEIPSGLRESALVLGLPPRARLWRIELPMASRSILAGIKIAAVINVGTATIGALIGAGGYGEPILTGIRLDDLNLILQGAVPAAALALLVQGLFGWLERWLVPRGLLLPGK